MISRFPKGVHMILNGLLWLVRSSFCSSSTRWLHKYTPQVLPPSLRLAGQELQFWDPTGPCPVGPGHHGASMAETSCEVRTFLLGAYDWGCPTAGRSGPPCSSIYSHTFQFIATAFFSQGSNTTSKLAGSGRTWNYSLHPTFCLLGKMGLLCKTLWATPTICSISNEIQYWTFPQDSALTKINECDI